MRHSSLFLAVVVLLSTTIMLAQHSSGGGSSGSSSSGGGGSHGGSSGGSVSSGSSGGGHSSSGGSSGSSHSSAGSHSSGGSHNIGNNHVFGDTSVSHGSNIREPNFATSSGNATHSNLRSGELNIARSLREPSGLQARPAQPEKRSFFSFLRHPFHRPEPKPAPDLRHRICLTGPCQICPPGHKGGCGVAVIPIRRHGVCSNLQAWSGGACVFQANVLGDCSGIRMLMERQAQRMQAAESIRQNACAAGATQACSDATAAWQSEQSFYLSLRARYLRCQQQNGSGFPFLGFSMSGYRSGRWLDSPRFELHN